MARLNAGPASEAELREVAGWGERVRLAAAAFDLVQSGEMVIAGMRDGEPVFQRADQVATVR